MAGIPNKINPEGPVEEVEKMKFENGEIPPNGWYWDYETLTPVVPREISCSRTFGRFIVTKFTRSKA